MIDNNCCLFPDVINSFLMYLSVSPMIVTIMCLPVLMMIPSYDATIALEDYVLL